MNKIIGIAMFIGVLLVGIEQTHKMALTGVSTDNKNLPLAFAVSQGAPQKRMEGALPQSVTTDRVLRYSETLEQARTKAQNFDELEFQYYNRTIAELQWELEQSRRRIGDENLVSHANQGLLNLEEATILVTELRRQGVLSKLIAKQRIGGIRKKYL